VYDSAKELCTITTQWGKYEHQRLPMGLCNSPDIFQEKMNDLLDGLDTVQVYIDDILHVTKGCGKIILRDWKKCSAGYKRPV
jgi:hypothetical protein